MYILPTLTNADVENGSDLVDIGGAVLSDLNCRPGALVAIAGVAHFILERVSTTQLRVERPWAGATADGLPCAIGVFTPEMANRTELARQLRDYSARLALMDSRGHGLFYRTLGATGSADPGPGRIAYVGASWQASSALCIDVLDAGEVDATALIDQWALGDILLVQSIATGSYVAFALSEPPTNEGPDAWRKVTEYSYIGGSGALVDDEDVRLVLWRAGTPGAGFATDEEADTTADLTTWDNEAAGFTVFVQDMGGANAGRAAVNRREGAAGNWAVVAWYTGPRGIQGYKGWSPQLVAVADGARRVLRLTGYVGGEGAAPTANVGDYLKADGTFTSVIGDAVDFRGVAGPAGANGGGFKGAQVRVVLTGNVNLAGGAIAAGTTHNGVTLDSNDLVLCIGQTAPAENGVYPAPAAGAAVRHADFDAWDDFPGAYFSVTEGITGSDTLWRCTSNKGGTLGTTALTFTQFVTDTSAIEADVAALQAEVATLDRILQVALFELADAKNDRLGFPDGIADPFDDESDIYIEPAGIDSYAKLVLHFDGANGATTTIDSSPAPKTVTFINGAVIDTTNSKFGGSSLKCGDGVDDYALVDDSADWHFGNGDFSIDFWLKRTAVSSAAENVCGQGSSTLAGGYHYFQLQASNVIQYRANDDTIVTGSAGAIADTNWHHVAVVRSGATIAVAVDGAWGTSNNIGTTALTDSSGRFAIGQLGEYVGGSSFNGWIDEFRVSKGVARWTPGVAFSPPTSAYAVPTGVGSQNQVYNTATDLFSPSTTGAGILDNAMKSANAVLSGAPLLTWTGPAGSPNVACARGTVSRNSGKYYFEYKCNTAGTFSGVGIVDSTNFSGDATNLGYNQAIMLVNYTTQLHINGSGSAYGSPFVAGDTIRIGIDFDTGKVFFGINATWLQSSNPETGANPATTFTAGATKYPIVGGYGSTPTGVLNFGASAFSYAVPAGYSAWAPGIAQNMQLVSKAFTAAAVPAVARLALQAIAREAITVNTDLKGWVSRDGGATWTQATLVYDAQTGFYEDNEIDISGQPSGTSMKWKAANENNKNVDHSGVIFRWKQGA